ncbi:MAG: TonB-dependent receptor, partial [Sphingomonadaceae bacterium]|nr:TonB-dependent receptor [Sphingomonadaceae bacterium]
MKKYELLAASALAMTAVTPAFAQTAPANPPADARAVTTANTPDAAAQQAAEPATPSYGEDIVVTAQRQSERLQDVPIAVTAFTGAALERQQINNPTQLQLTLPSITFTKTNFTSSSFTIRGIGDLCVGVTCDQATGIHVNELPLQNTRLFESEFYDLERIEVLRGPQGTLFGRNATSGVVDFITAKPDLSGIHAYGQFEYGNYDSKQVKGAFNLPITKTIGIRVAGLYLDRDGYTYNQFNNSRIDGRNLYSVRGTLSWEPDPNTRVDLIGYYFREKDNRARVQKQLCGRDTTGILGCRPDQLGYGVVNANSQLTTGFSSQQTINLGIAGAFPAAVVPLIQALYAPLTTGSIYAPDGYANAVNPTDNRTINSDFTPRYYAEEEQYTAKVFHDFGGLALNITAGYSRSEVSAQEAYNLAVASFPASSLAALNAYATPGVLSGIVGPALGPSLTNIFAAYRNALIPNGPAGGLCTSNTDPNGVGVFGGNRYGCPVTPLAFDESSQRSEQWSAEAHLDSKWDGPFNFLIGGIYYDSLVHNNSYYVNAFPLDYTSALLGSLVSVGGVLGGNPNTPALFRASPFFRNNTARYELSSYGIFGEAYYGFSDKLKLTLGLRYNHDDKTVSARSTLYQDAVGNAVLAPVGATNINQSIGYGNLDFDPFTPGNQDFARQSVKFNRLTGRAVLDYKITRDNLLYASYSRGYKSGGFNPPLSPSFAVSPVFAPETIDSFEVGSKNNFGHGQFRLNLTGFYYKYKGLQLSRIVSRTAVNDNVDANIYGVEAEAIISPTPAFVVNANFSWLRSEVASDKFLADTRDPSGGRSDTVIIKDLTTAANCAVVPTTPGNAVGTNTFVGAINGALGLRAPTPVPGTTTTGAYSVCSALAGAAANPSAPLRALFQTPTGALPFTVLGSGVET